MSLTNNQAVLSWIDEMTKLTKPDNIVWITGRHAHQAQPGEAPRLLSPPHRP